MSELLKSYDNAAGRTCEVRYDTAHYPRPFWVDASPGTVSTHVAPETHFATPLQRQSGAN